VPRSRALLVAVIAVFAAAVPAASQAQAQAPPPSPRAVCGPGAIPEPGIQGRVPDGGGERGYRCNLEQVGHEGVFGGFKALRYVDAAGHECAYYDTTLTFPLNAQGVDQHPTGVAVLDMKDPAHPVLTASLQTPAMQSPHESLELNPKRGLLAAVTGNAFAYPGQVDIYDVSEDCRSPALQSSLPVGVFGHESGFAQDGRTFYATSLSTGQVTAIDVTDPKRPVPLAVGQVRSHGLTLSDDGRRAYVAATEGLIILDVSDIQDRRPDPQMREVSRLDWPELTIPQVALPVTIGRHPYLVEIDEFSGEPNRDKRLPSENGPRVGAGRIIDIADERAPKVISNFRLAVHQPENRPGLAGDPGATSFVQGYAGHYCNVPSRVDPGIVACSMILSGLRVFDIRDPRRPKEVAYFVTPRPRRPATGDPANYAMSRPAFVPERREIWYTDGNSGFYALRMAEDVWPSGPAPGSAACAPSSGLRSVSVRRRGRGRVRLGFARRVASPVRIDVFRVSRGRRVIRERRVARFARRSRPAVWRPHGDGVYFVRFSLRRGGRVVDVRRVVLRVRGGRVARRPPHHRRESCGLIRRFKLERPVFGGTRRTPLRGSFQLARDARYRVTITRRGRVVRRFAGSGRRARFSLRARGRARGDYRVTLRAGGASATLISRRL
jgi:hypothetical protein